MIESPGNLPRARLRRARLLTSRTHAPTPHWRTLIPRLVSIDAYLGLVMFLMMAEVLKFCELAKALGLLQKTSKLPANLLWEVRFFAHVCHHQSHVDWVGCSLYELIQPSFSFLVEVAPLTGERSPPIRSPDLFSTTARSR